MDDTTLTVLLVLAICIPVAALFGHLWVAYAYTPRRSQEAARAYLKSDEGQEDVGELIQGWLTSESGRATLTQFVATMGEVVKGKIEGLLTGAAGNAAKAAATKGAELLGAVDFGDPVLNGLWGFVPPDLKKKFLRRVMGTARKGFTRQVFDTEGADVTDDTPALGGGEDWPT